VNSNGVLYPNVTRIPGSAGDVSTENRSNLKDIRPGEFDQALSNALNTKQPASADLSQIKAGIKFSSHASQRLQERKINMDAKMMSKMNEAIDRAAAKGLEESLIISPDAAFIVSVKNRTVITAMDRDQMSGNVFTNIDGAVVI